MTPNTLKKQRAMIRSLSAAFGRAHADQAKATKAYTRASRHVSVDTRDAGERLRDAQLALEIAAERFVTYVMQHDHAFADICDRPHATVVQAIDAGIKKSGGDMIQFARMIRATLRNIATRSLETNRKSALAKCDGLAWDGTVASLAQCLVSACKGRADYLDVRGQGIDARKALEVARALPADATVSLTDGRLIFRYRDGRGQISLYTTSEAHRAEGTITVPVVHATARAAA
jgi:hypothetical protein